jgi:hypothetical protein
MNLLEGQRLLKLFHPLQDTVEGDDWIRSAVGETDHQWTW